MNTAMGLDSSKTDSKHHLPSTVYRPYRKPGEPSAARFTVIQELKHPGPLGVDQPLRISACGFAVDDDSMLISLTTFPVPDTGRTFRAGFVQSWDLHNIEEGHDDSLFTYSPRPVFGMSPDGKIICSILNSGKGQLILIEKGENCTLEPCKIECLSRSGNENLSARTACCVISPNGSMAVTISNVTLALLHGREINEMCLWKIKPGGVFQSCWKVSCEVCLPKFSGHLGSCVFSPDSTLLAISTSNSQLYVIKSETLEVYETIRSETSYNNKCMCAFDPRYANNKLAACFTSGKVEVWKLGDGKPRCIKAREVALEPQKITTFIYCPDGTLIAFGISDGRVLVYETEFYKCIYVLDPKQHITTRTVEELEVCSVAFPKSCQEIAVGYSDGYVCIWQLPVKMELHHMCRMKINQLVPANQIEVLPLPHALKAYLLYSYLNVDTNWLGT